MKSEYGMFTLNRQRRLRQGESDTTKNGTELQVSKKSSIKYQFGDNSIFIYIETEIRRQLK